MNRFAADECGATMVEYTILIGLITVVAIALIRAFHYPNIVKH